MMDYILDQPIFIIMVLTAYAYSGYEPFSIYGTTHGLSFSAILFVNTSIACSEKDLRL